MIIPIGHDQQIQRYPWVTIVLIALCTLVQIYSTVAAPSHAEIEQIQADLYSANTEEEAQDVVARAERLLDKIPAWRFGYRVGGDDASGLSYRLITSAFVHDGWLHLIGNMLFLWLVGAALEDRWGKWRFALFYALGAIAATYAFELTYSGEETLLVGASGAVSASMGAFLVYFYKTEITLWYFIMYRTGTFRLAAYVALPIWLADQFLMASLDRGVGVQSVAYAAHIGGFAFGFVGAIAAKMVFGDKPASTDDEYEDDDAPAEPRAAKDDDRERKLLEAIRKQDIATVRTLGSRVMIDLGRQKDHRRVLDLYRAIVKAGFRTMPLTDGAFVVAANAADKVGDFSGYFEIAEALRLEHPGSVQVPKVLWRLAELHAQSGNTDEELATLKHLAERYPRHEHGGLAVKALAKRSA